MVTALLLTVSVTGLSAQSSSINAYSPYTFYGIGEINTPGPSYLRSMGGAAMGFRSSMMINYLNPASYSAVGQRSVLFNFGLEGQNFYSSNATTSTSYNTFNVRDIAFVMPLAKGIGLGVSVTPYSSVGYNVESVDQNVDIEGSVGSVNYLYTGSGGVNQYKVGVGWQVAKWLSVGADAAYYAGSISRSFNEVISVITGNGSYNNIYGEQSEKISHIYGIVGFQSNLIATRKTVLTLGGTYQMGGKMKNRVTRYIPTSGIITDTVQLKESISNFAMPSTYTIGAYLHRQNFSIGADYEFSDWGRRNSGDATSQYSFRNTSTVKLGGQYIPNAADVRKFWRRWTYRAGVRYSQYYMVVNGTQIDDKALTLGLGIPIRYTGLSNINLGAEVGQRGSTTNGLVKETYFKFSIGLSLFGEDNWFYKHKYN